MKKFLLSMLLVITSVAVMSANDLSATKENNLNKVVLERWQNVDKVVILGAVAQTYLKGEIESITIDGNGILTIVGKVNAKGNATDIHQVSFFTKRVMVRKTKKQTVMTVTSETGITKGLFGF